MYENCMFLESPIVNKFKKTMTLYHASLYYKGDKVLKPSFISVGNKLERKTGPSIFFFSKHQYAKNFLLGSAARKIYQTYLEDYTRVARTYPNPEWRREFEKHYELIHTYRLNILPPLTYSLSYDAKVYHLDDKGKCPLPICHDFKRFLESQDGITVYIYECEVETSKINHGHSDFLQEFNVFEPVEVKKVHEYTLSELVSQVKITTVPFNRVIKYGCLVSAYHRKDLVRSVISYDDWYERKV